MPGRIDIAKPKRGDVHQRKIEEIHPVLSRYVDKSAEPEAMAPLEASREFESNKQVTHQDDEVGGTGPKHPHGVAGVSFARKSQHSNVQPESPKEQEHAYDDRR